eukprot:3209038-Amphidinium_carterae.1
MRSGKKTQELSCDHAAAYVNSMRPGARIKPHMGGPSSGAIVVQVGYTTMGQAGSAPWPHHSRAADQSVCGERKAK